MTTADFDRIIDRRGTESTKWDRLRVEYQDEDLLPLWLADMDFATSEAIRDALVRRAEHPIYGYTDRGPLYPRLFADRFRTRYGVPVESDNVVLSTGVMDSIAAAISLFTQPGDSIVIPRPCYHPFVATVVGSRRRPVFSDMLPGEHGYEYDWDGLERAAAEATAIIVCNPHNPTGRVCTEDELRHLADIAEKNDLLVISDEIHADFTYAPHALTPIANLGKGIRGRLVSCVSPTKSFNLAGVKVSAALIWNPDMLSRFRAHASTIGISSINIFALEALKAAYLESQDWQDELLSHLEKNRGVVKAFIEAHAPQVEAHLPEGTYFYWMRLPGMHGAYERLIREGHVALGNGRDFHPDADEFVRLNFACPRTILDEALSRIGRVLEGGMPA